jgi:hypothetical protein
METDMKESGEIIRGMDMGPSSIVTVTLILENFKKVNIMGKVAFIGVMAVIMREISKMDWSMVKESGLNLEMIQLPIHLRGATNSTKKMDLAPLNGNQVILTKEILSKTWERVTARWIGMKGQSTWETGPMIFRMAMVS